MPIQFQDESLSLPPLFSRYFLSLSLALLPRHGRSRASIRVFLILRRSVRHISALTIRSADEEDERAEISTRRRRRPLLRGIIHVINKRAFRLIVIVSAAEPVGELSPRYLFFCAERRSDREVLPAFIRDLTETRWCPFNLQ